MIRIHFFSVGFLIGLLLNTSSDMQAAQQFGRPEISNLSQLSRGAGRPAIPTPALAAVLAVQPQPIALALHVPVVQQPVAPDIAHAGQLTRGVGRGAPHASVLPAIGVQPQLALPPMIQRPVTPTLSQSHGLPIAANDRPILLVLQRLNEAANPDNKE